MACSSTSKYAPKITKSYIDASPIVDTAPAGAFTLRPATFTEEEVNRRPLTIKLNFSDYNKKYNLKQEQKKLKRAREESDEENLPNKKPRPTLAATKGAVLHDLLNISSKKDEFLSTLRIAPTNGANLITWLKGEEWVQKIMPGQVAVVCKGCREECSIERIEEREVVQKKGKRKGTVLRTVTKKFVTVEEWVAHRDHCKGIFTAWMSADAASDDED